MSIFSSLKDNIKNIPGWKTDRKMVIFAVDDYGNVRLDSRKARENMDRAGMKAENHFDAFDTLETRPDLEALYDVLDSVKDQHGNPAVFTPFSLPCNIDFEAMAQEGYERYSSHTVRETFQQQSERYPEAYSGAWELMQEGMSKSIMAPKYHGREHLNLKIFEDKLQRKDEDIMTALKNHSYTSINYTGNTPYSYTATFGFEETGELDRLRNIVIEGLKIFEEEYGVRSVSFTPPAGEFSPLLEPALADSGVVALNRSLTQKQYYGDGSYKREWNYTGKRRKNGLQTIVRNVVFEPTHDRGTDPVKKALKQMEAAFRWNRPAIISSHRVNFCGFIEEANRKKGLEELQRLLDQIVLKWPDVEFVSVEDLVEDMRE